MNESDCPLSKTRKILWQIWTKRKFYCTQKELQSEKCVVYISAELKNIQLSIPQQQQCTGLRLHVILEAFLQGNRKGKQGIWHFLVLPEFECSYCTFYTCTNINTNTQLRRTKLIPCI